MDRQVEVTYRWAVNKSASDHDPAGECLGDEQHSHQKIDAEFPEGDFPCKDEVENRNGVNQPRKTCNKSMDPFHVEDELIFFQIQVEVDLFEFGCLLIFGKFILPCFLSHGWDGSADGIPFGDRKP